MPHDLYQLRVNIYTDNNLHGSLLISETQVPQIAYIFCKKVCFFPSIIISQKCWRVYCYFLTMCWCQFYLNAVRFLQFVRYHMLHVKPIDSSLENFPAKIPFGENSEGENSVRRNFRSAKFTVGESLVRRNFRSVKIPTAIVTSAKITSSKIPSALLFIGYDKLAKHISGFFSGRGLTGSKKMKKYFNLGGKTSNIES